MNKNKGRVQQGRKLTSFETAQAQSHNDSGISDDEPTIEVVNDLPILGAFDDLELNVVTRVKRKERTGELVDFAVMLLARDVDGDGSWCDVSRVDCAHGAVHVDMFTKGGVQSKPVGIVPVHCEQDLDAALVWATEYIWDVEERLMGWK